MTLVFSDFRRSFLSLTLIVACQTSAKPGNSASTPVGSSPTNRCKNVYFSLHAGTPNKKIGTLLQEMNKIKVSIVKARNILCKGMFTLDHHFSFPLFWNCSSDKGNPMDFNLVYPVLINLFSSRKNLQKLSLGK